MQRTFRRRLFFAVLLSWMLFCGGGLWAAEGDPLEASVPGAFTLGSVWGDGFQEYTADLLLPLWRWPRGLLFFNPRFSLTDLDGTAEEFNLGLGLRKMIGGGAILGGNLYYDHRRSAHEKEYDQLGAGVEFFSQWVDARFNYYLPKEDREVTDSFDQVEQRQSRRSWWEDPYAAGHGIWQQRRIETTTTTITHRFESYEQALEGWDAELGLRLPLLPDWLETRVFCGGYHFEAPYGEDVTGWKGRLEVRPLRGLVLDAAFFEDEELYGADWLLGARVSVPFEPEALLAGGNPFKGLEKWFKPGKRAFAERLGEMVMRDTQVRTEQWGPLENLSKQRTEIEKEIDRKRYELMRDVMFVDAGRVGDLEEGTWEHPFDRVQEGVDGVFGQRNVYVNAFEGSYRENVVLSDGVQLYGSGWLIPGFGGISFGSGIQPLIDGGGSGPVIRLASDNSVRGFHLVNMTPGAPMLEIMNGGFPVLVENTGIFGSGFGGNTVIEGNTIDTLGDGIVLAPTGGTLAIRDNTIDAGAGSLFLPAGLMLWVFDSPGLSIEISGNRISSDFIGMYIDAINSTIDNIAISGNAITSSMYGLVIESLLSSIGNASIAGNAISGSIYGLAIGSFGSSINNLSIVSNAISSDILGMYLLSIDSSINNLSIIGNDISAGGVGLYLIADDSAITADISANHIASVWDGIWLETAGTGTITAFTSGLPNTITFGAGFSAIDEDTTAGGTIFNSLLY